VGIGADVSQALVKDVKAQFEKWGKESASLPKARKFVMESCI
jgi:hypothetical protein